MRRLSSALAAATVVAAALVGGGVVVARSEPSPRPGAAGAAARPATDPSAAAPLAGRTVVIDPGHQLGNSRFPRKINRLVDAGGLRKPCNTTGTATRSGWAEATFAWRVATHLRDRLHDLGARVVMTRQRNSRERWGPCVDVRGKIGNRGFRGRSRAADLKISIHADGAARSGRGFHVIVTKHRGAVARSLRFGRTLRAALEHEGFGRSTYTAGGRGLVRRADLGTLNLSRIPTAMVELGNMRNPHDARTMRSTHGRQRYAAAMLRAVTATLRR